MGQRVNLAQAVKRASRVFLIGNGGSAANAIHISNDWVACGIDARPLLDIGTITAIANDFGYKYIFSKQIYVVGEKDALLVALSGSGKSPNILEGLRAAKKKNMTTWLIVGESNSPASRLAHYTTEDGDNMQDAEEWQIRVGHMVMRWLKKHS